jgi:predicted RND superfamily exporter protein
LPTGIDHHLLMEARIQRIERLLTKRNARLVLGLLGVLTVVFALALRNVRLDHDFEKFFPTDDPELDRYLAFRERFGNDNDMLLVAATHAPTVFDRAFLQRFDSLAGALAAVPDALTPWPERWPRCPTSTASPVPRASATRG